MTTYALLPGACHGPWCSTATIAALDERGHRAITIDLQSTTPHQHISDPVGPPSALCASIVCTDDRVATAAWGRWAAHERLLDALVVELSGSHSPFPSRPGLADALVELRGRL